MTTTLIPGRAAGGSWRTTRAATSAGSFPLRQERFLPAREAHVAGERELTAVSGRPPPDQRDRNERGARQAHQDVRPCLQAGRTLRDAGQILELREEVGVIQEEAVDGAFEDHHRHPVVVLERRDDLPDLPNELRAHEVDRRVVEYDPAA
jgi:hypothetical protein